jgi:hypothetical protein
MPALLPILSLAWSILTSRIGNILLAGLLAFAWGHHRASVACDARVAGLHAQAVRAVVEDQARQIREARKIDLVDDVRVREKAAAADAMQAEIDALRARLERKESSNAKRKIIREPCADLDDFARRVQRLDRSGRR